MAPALRLRRGHMGVFLLMVSLTAASAAPPAPAGAISPICVTSGQTMQTDCKPELDAASKHLGVTAQDDSKKIDDLQLSAYLATVRPPSTKCCKAACAFNSHYCNCDPTILSLAASFSGNNQNQYMMITDYFAAQCHYQLRANTTKPNSCPLGDLTKAPPLPACP